MWHCNYAFLLLLFLLHFTSSQTLHEGNETCSALNNLQTSVLPSTIRLRAGVLHAPPFAVTKESNFSGFQIDLMERLKIYAAQDNITLEILYSKAPNLYSDAFDLVANDCNSTINTANKLTVEDCHMFD